MPGLVVSQSAMSISQLNVSGANARPDGLAATIPVRPIDPTRQRFQVEDQVSADDASAQAKNQADAADGDAASQGGAGRRAAAGWGGNGSGLLGAFTSFLARMFSQAQDAAETSATSPASMRAGIQAYGRVATPESGFQPGAEVLAPGFPRLSSGRAVDLSV
jgi:hypothetical protein